MPIPFQCPACNIKIKAPDAAAGKRLSCPGCKQVVAVPGTLGASAPIPFAEPPPPPVPRERIVEVPPPFVRSRVQPRTPPALRFPFATVATVVLSGFLLSCGVSCVVFMCPLGSEAGASKATAVKQATPQDDGPWAMSKADADRIAEAKRLRDLKPKGDGRRALSYSETLLAIRDRRLRKGDRVTFANTSFIVNETLSDKKGFALSPSWDRKIVIIVVKEFVTEEPVAGTLRIKGVWDIYEADTLDGQTVYALIPYPPPPDW